MEWITTSTVLVRLGAFDNDAWDCFAARFRDPIVCFAQRMGLCAADAEDVAQETLLAFADQFRNGHYDREKGRLSKWLFGIAYRQAQSGRRQQARRARWVRSNDAGMANLTDEAMATRTWDEEWERAILVQCLQRVRQEVDPSTLRAFELVVREEKSPAEAANILGAPIKHVYNAKHRVLKRLRELRCEIEETV